MKTVYLLHFFDDGVMNVLVFSKKDKADAYAKKSFGTDYKTAKKNGKMYALFTSGDYGEDDDENELEKVYAKVEKSDPHFRLFYIQKEKIDPEYDE